MMAIWWRFASPLPAPPLPTSSPLANSLVALLFLGSSLPLVAQFSIRWWTFFCPRCCSSLFPWTRAPLLNSMCWTLTSSAWSSSSSSSFAFFRPPHPSANPINRPDPVYEKKRLVIAFIYRNVYDMEEASSGIPTSSNSCADGSTIYTLTQRRRLMRGAQQFTIRDSPKTVRSTWHYSSRPIWIHFPDIPFQSSCWTA